MDVKTAVKDKANYADIVAWFRSQGELDVETLELLADTISEMSEEIFEHYKALCDLLKGQLQRIRRICREEGVRNVFPDGSMRDRVLTVLTKACEQKAVLPERYEELAKVLKNNI